MKLEKRIVIDPAVCAALYVAAFLIRVRIRKTPSLSRPHPSRTHLLRTITDQSLLWREPPALILHLHFARVGAVDDP